MLSHFSRLFTLLAAGAIFAGCIEQYPGGSARSRYESEYGKNPTLQRDQFVGSIYFATGSSALSKAALADVARMASRIGERRNAATKVVLVGYSDRRRGVEENSELAAERAQKVALALEKKGVELDRLVIDSRPVVLTRAQSGERRVDIYLDATTASQPQVLYPILIALFLVTVSILAVIIFRRRR